MDTNERELLRKPDLDPTHELPIPHDMELPPPNEMELPPPHDMLLKPHFTHKHPWLHWTPALFGLLIGIFIGIFLTQGAPENRQQINQYYTLTPTPLTTTIAPTANNSYLIKTTLPDGTVKITNPQFGFEIVAPQNYVVSTDTQNFTIRFEGPNSNQHLQDFAGLYFNTEILNTSTLEEKVKESYKQIKMNNDGFVNFNDITNININGIQGFSYPCPFLVTQECIFLPLNAKNYLSILKNYSDGYNRGYSKQLDQILSTFRLIDTPPISSTTNENATGKFCGGIAANLPENQCPEGFYCKYEGNYPDAGGICVKE